MKLFFSITLLVMIMFPIASSARMAERMADPAGRVDSYFSDNGVFEVTITYGRHLASWSLKKNGASLWSEPLTDEPGAAAVSDNGQTITLPLWGWRDEGGSSGIAVYDSNGHLVREILFRGERGDEMLRWVRQTTISPDGKNIAIGQSGKERASVALFDAAEGRLIWETSAGFPELECVRVAANGDHTLAATRKSGSSDMEFLLFDKQGKIIWKKQKAKNSSYEARPYVKFKTDGKGFAIYDLKTASYQSFVVPGQGSPHSSPRPEAGSDKKR